MSDQLDIVSVINKLIRSDSQRIEDVGMAVQAMVINGPAYIGHTPYQAFEHFCPAPGIGPGHFPKTGQLLDFCVLLNTSTVSREFGALRILSHYINKVCCYHQFPIQN